MEDPNQLIPQLKEVFNPLSVLGLPERVRERERMWARGDYPQPHREREREREIDREAERERERVRCRVQQFLKVIQGGEKKKIEVK